ncbi:MAG: succinate dehydrogenase, hydrophobic membrane anchor protein [Gammaproteobacteria bacterium]|nr:succinate dehydrogenase, hydrophobic membrane anchor protein [Gammaproteobacteria bacterium]
MALRSPLGRALGLGSAKSGFGHWWGQRLSAGALVLLGLWFAVSLLGLASTDYWAVAAWVGEPRHAILLILFLITLLYHSSLGVQVVIEDYVHEAPAKVSALVVNRFLHVALAVAGVYSVVTLSVGGQA